jgi:hypothetical protein
MPRLTVLITLLAAVTAAGPVLAQAAGKADRLQKQMRERLDFYKTNPMSIYLAKGAPHSCGETCDTWIAADGTFDPGAAHRLLEFLARPGHGGLPIYFNSRGGLVTEAMEIGIMLRVRKMTAGVARSLPRDCKKASKDACEEAKRSEAAVPSELLAAGAICHSACVYALMGATTRHVSPEAKVGVHSPTAFLVARDGHVAGAPQDRVAKFNKTLKRYVEEMGIGPGLLDVTMHTPATRVHILKREEIFRFGIDPRDVIESRWRLEQSGTGRAVVKSVSERRTGARPDFRPSQLRLSCERRDRVRVEYARPLVPAEADVPSEIRLGGAEDSIAFPEKGPTGAPLVDRVRAALVPSDFLVSAAAGPEIVIAETFQPARAEPWSRKVALSTAGLSEALQTLLSRCP